MTKTRRDFLKISGSVGLALLLSPTLLAKRKQRLRLSQVLQVAWPSARDTLCNPFNDPELNAAYVSGSVSFQPLGPVAEYNGKLYTIRQISIPIVWLKADEYGAEERLIDITAKLIENAIHAHDTVITYQFPLKQNKLVSRNSIDTA